MDIDEDLENPIREATLRCRDLLEKCQELPELLGGAWIEEQQADFNWWTHGLNATKMSHSSLDHRLSQRPDIKRVVLNHLECISDALKECIRISEDSSTSQDLEDDREFDDRIPSWSDSGSDASGEGVSSQDNVPTTRYAQQQYYIQTQILLLSKLSLTIRRSGAKLRHQFADTALVVRNDHYDSLRNYLRWLLFRRLHEKWREFSAPINQRSTEDPAPPVDTLHFIWTVIQDKTLTSVQNRLIEAVVIRRNRFEFSKSPWPVHATGLSSTHTGQASKRKVTANRLSSPQRNKVVKTSHISQSSGPQTSRDMSSMTSNHARVTSGSAIFSKTATAVGSEVPQMSDSVKNEDLASFVTQITSTQLDCKHEYPPLPRVDQPGNSFRCPFCCQVLPKGTLETGTKWRRVFSCREAMVAEVNRHSYRGHVAYDILPYNCVFAECNAPNEMYLTREDWIHHMKLNHSVKRWLCEFCSNTNNGKVPFTYSTAHDLASHLNDSHSSANKSIVPLHALVENSARQILPKVQCPLCPEEEVFHELESSTHIARHLHSFALNSLPWENTIPEAETSSAKLRSDQWRIPGFVSAMAASSGSQKLQENVSAHGTELNSDYRRSVPLWVQSTQTDQVGDFKSAQIEAEASASRTMLDRLSPTNEDVSETEFNEGLKPTDAYVESARSSPVSNVVQKHVDRKPSIEAQDESVEKTPDRGRPKLRSRNPRSKPKQQVRTPGPSAPEKGKEEGIVHYIPAYHLRPERLRTYLQALFPAHEINVSEIHEDKYLVRLPREMTAAEFHDLMRIRRRRYW